MVNRRQISGAVGCASVCEPPSCLDLGRKQAEEKKAGDEFTSLVNSVIKMPDTHSHTHRCACMEITVPTHVQQCNKSTLYPFKELLYGFIWTTTQPESIPRLWVVPRNDEL